ncbi:Wall-associated receptor kinase 2 [Forsythia ovata]|uniref:Wall-associated receptor kinase 2 n=1 Tax=Forsythia ovata TaxID=205694 RepID=A0ABD1VMB4_9LAMI
MLPAGEFQVKGDLLGQCGSIDPEYANSMIVNQKTDVYSIGLVLLNLLSGQQFIWPHPTEEIVGTTECDKGCFVKDQVKPSIDQKIIEEGNEAEIQLQDFLDLALRYIQEKGEDRPDMMTVAEELRKIKKSGHHSQLA